MTGTCKQCGARYGGLRPRRPVRREPGLCYSCQRRWETARATGAAPALQAAYVALQAHRSFTFGIDKSGPLTPEMMRFALEMYEHYCRDHPGTRRGEAPVRVELARGGEDAG